MNLKFSLLIISVAFSPKSLSFFFLFEMGNKHSNKKSHSYKEESPKQFGAIRDKYETIEQVQDGLKAAGLESSNLLIGIDFTYSNKVQS